MAKQVNQASGTPRKQGASGDPVASTLIVALLLLFIVILGSMGTLLWYSTQLNRAPRSEAERKLAIAQGAVAAKPKDVQTWASLALAQAEAGQYGDAEDTIAKARKLQDVALLDVIFADIANLSGDKGEAIKRYETAKQRAKQQYDAHTADLKQKGVTNDVANKVYAEAAIAEGRVLMEYARYREAKAQFDEALAIQPQMADVLVFRGNAEAKLGDVAAAKRDYQQALSFVANMPEAVQGLRELQKGN